MTYEVVEHHKSGLSAVFGPFKLFTEAIKFFVETYQCSEDTIVGIEIKEIV